MKRYQGTKMKLYDMKMAPNPRRVRVFLAEKRHRQCEVIACGYRQAGTQKRRPHREYQLNGSGSNIGTG